MRPRIRLPLPILFWVCSVSLAAEPKHDRFGDPLPEGAIARLGSLLLRTEQTPFAAAFAADGNMLTVIEGNSVSFWDLATGKAIRRVELKNRERLWRLSDDGKTLIQSGFDNVLRIVDTATGAEQRTLNHAQRGFIQAFEVSRDGKILVAIHRASIALWDVPGGKLLHEFKGPQIVPLSPHWLTALTADGKRLILPHSDGTLHLMDTATGKEIRAFEMPPARSGIPSSLRVERLALSPDGRYLAYGGSTVPLTVCELATGKRLHEWKSLQGIISGLAFTSNGRFLAANDYAGIHLFGVLSGKEILKLPRLNATNGRLIFSPDGRRLAMFEGCTINLWDMVGERRQHPIVGHRASIHSMAFFPDGKRLVSADYLGKTIAWDIASASPLAQRKNNTSSVSLAVDEDGESVRFVGYDISAHLWNPRTGREENRPNPIVGLSTNQLALSPDGRSLAVLTFDVDTQLKRPATRRLRLYDLKTKKSVVLPGLPEQSWVGQMLFAPDSRRLAASCNDGVLRLWDRDSGQLVREFKKEQPGGQPTRMVFAADGRSLALFDGMIRIREIAGGAERLQIPPVPGSLFALAYSPDGRFLACGLDDGRIFVYSAVSGKQLAQWDGKQAAVRALAFSRDSRSLASGGANGTILIWEVPKDETLPGLKAEEAVALWQTLGDREGAAVNRALARLAAAPVQTLLLFKERLRPLGKPLDRERLNRLIADLDEDTFKVRERASRELALIGPDAAAALRQALRHDPSAESKKRIEDLLARLDKGGDPQRMRFLRAVEVLERIGTSQAKDMLRALADKPLLAELREEVQASLRRLGEKP